MNGAAIFQVSPDDDVEVLDRVDRPGATFLGLGCPQRIKVAERLRGMFVTPVARVDYRNGCVVSGSSGSAFERMSHDDRIGIVADDPYHVGDRLTLGRGGLI